MTNQRKGELATWLKTMERRKVRVRVSGDRGIYGEITGVNDKQGILALQSLEVNDGPILMIPFEHIVYVSMAIGAE